MDRLRSAGLAAGGVAACSIVALVDPHDGGYPACPTQVLLGVDRPFCGSLRGINSLLHGRVAEALDHNLLLALLVPIAVIAWVGWVRAALGREDRRPPGSPPRSMLSWVRPSWVAPGWVLPAVVGVALAFAVARNLPVSGLSWLASDASTT